MTAPTALLVRSLLAATVLLLPEALAAAPAPKPAAGEVQRGRALYESVGCFQCHGYVGQGSTFSGPALAPAPLGQASFRAAVRTPRAVMPAYSPAVLPDEQLDAILAYLRSIPAGKSPNEIALLAARESVDPVAEADRGRGGALYATHCAACHGAALEGGSAASLTAESVKRSARATAQLIMNPPQGMPKLHPQPLSTQDVTAIAAFVRAGR